MVASIKLAVLCTAFGVIVGGTMAHANKIPSAYLTVAQNAGIPPEVLYAVALTESGISKGQYAWPWTLNIAGRGRYFKTRDDACLALAQALKITSAKRVDIGLGQINYGYHGHRVNNPCELLEPNLNLSITADLLKSHYCSHEGWLMAIGRYHSPANNERAKRYRNDVNYHLTRLVVQK